MPMNTIQHEPTNGIRPYVVYWSSEGRRRTAPASPPGCSQLPATSLAMRHSPCSTLCCHSSCRSGSSPVRSIDALSDAGRVCYRFRSYVQHIILGAAKTILSVLSKPFVCRPIGRQLLKYARRPARKLRFDWSIPKANWRTQSMSGRCSGAFVADLEICGSRDMVVAKMRFAQCVSGTMMARTIMTPRRFAVVQTIAFLLRTPD